MVLTQTQKTDIKGLITEILDEDWYSKIILKITNVIKEEVHKKMKDMEEEIKQLRQGIEKEKAKTSMLENKIDEIEQYGRRQNLRIFGIDEKKNENTEELVLNIFNNKMGINIQPHMIQRSHRVGKPAPNKNRAIIIKFQSYKDRNLVYRNKKNLKGSIISIKEDLTPQRQRLLKEALTILDKKHIWTIDGNIFTSINNKTLQIRKIQDIEDFQRMRI